MRRKLLKRILKMANVNMGELIPVWGRVLFAVLFPLEWMYLKNKYLNYDPCTDTFLLYGVKFSANILRVWAESGIPLMVKGVGCCQYCIKHETPECPVKTASPWSRWKNFCSEFSVVNENGIDNKDVFSHYAIVCEDITEDATNWGISFAGNNPEPDDFFEMKDKKTAYRMAEYINRRIK